MDHTQLEKFLKLTTETAQLAGEQIMKVYQTGNFDIDFKIDTSPVTMADRVAHNVIIEKLKNTYPILSEEGREIDFKIRREWEYFWLIDPLDGTKEFINKNGEFTVNIALIHEHSPILGIIYCPVFKKMYWGVKDHGSFLKNEHGNPQKLEGGYEQDQTIKRIVSSRLHSNNETEEFIKRYPHSSLVSMGSSLKFLMLAEGKADIYPRFVPTMEWDTAAAQIILEEAGGDVIEAINSRKLLYNKESLLNPSFIAHRKKVN